VKLLMVVILVLAGCVPGTWSRARIDDPKDSDEFTCERVHIGGGQYVKVIQWRFGLADKRAGTVMAVIGPDGRIIWNDRND
jgi:hypothetical protein